MGKPAHTLPSIPTPIVHSIASATAELVSCAILTPAEVLKQNAQIITSSPPSRGPRHVSSTSLQVLSRLRHHPTSLWRGYGALVARNLPFTGLQFPMFEAIKARLTSLRAQRTGQEKIYTSARDSDVRSVVLERAGITAVSAGLAGSIASAVTTPIDVVKTRIMLSADDGYEGRFKQPGCAASPLSSPSQKIRRGGETIWAVALELYHTEGVRGLFSGGALRACWTAVGLGLYLGAYDAGRTFLEHRRKEKERIRIGDGDRAT